MQCPDWIKQLILQNGTQLVFVSLVFSYLSQHEEVGFVPLDLSKVLEVATGRRKQKKRNIRIASCCHPTHQLVPLYTHMYLYGYLHTL